MKGFLLIAVSIGLTVLCWGAYGPILHNGQEAMQKSRLRPLMCVGMAYFVIGVVAPAILLWTYGEKGDWSFKGVLWSSAGGAVGAVGALGIILAFNFGGKPAYVMPLVFGFAPVVTAIITVGINKAYQEMPPTYLAGMLAGLIMVSIGAFLILFCANAGRPTPHATPPSSAPPPVQAPAEGS